MRASGGLVHANAQKQCTPTRKQRFEFCTHAREQHTPSSKCSGACVCVCVSVIWSNLFAFLRSPRDATRFWILDYSACMFSVKSCVVVCVFFLSVECCDWCA